MLWHAAVSERKIWCVYNIMMSDKVHRRTVLKLNAEAVKRRSGYERMRSEDNKSEVTSLLCSLHPTTVASHPNIAASHPNIAASHPNIAASHPNIAASHPNIAASHPNIAASQGRSYASGILTLEHCYVYARACACTLSQSKLL